jgi:hypothetical protein
MIEYVNQKLIVPYGKMTTTNKNITSFSLGDYSESYDKGILINGVDGSVFASALRSYGKVYKDEPVKTVLGD